MTEKLEGQLDIEDFGLADGDEVTAAFWEFHRENPHVLDSLIFKVRQAKRRGYQKVGMKMLFESLRWDYMMSTTPTKNGEPFKLNNNFTSYYARLVERRAPDLVGMFEKRKAKCEGGL